MGPTRKRDLAVGAVLVAVVGYVVAARFYGSFPPITVWTGLSLLVVAAAEAGWGFHVRSKIRAGKIGDASGWLHPLAVARAVMIAKASAWVGALALGWWLGVVTFFVPNRSVLRVAGEGSTGAVVAAVSALALVISALWLQHCCKSPDEPPEDADGAPG
ncbi:MAG: DUF3180 domain-containing protein [Mycobacterium sp.]